MRRSTRFLPITLLIFAFTSVVFFAHQGAIHAEDDHGDYRFTSTNLVIGSGAISGVIDTSNIMFDVDYFSFSLKEVSNTPSCSTKSRWITPIYP